MIISTFHTLLVISDALCIQFQELMRKQQQSYIHNTSADDVVSNMKIKHHLITTTNLSSIYTVGEKI